MTTAVPASSESGDLRETPLPRLLLQLYRTGFEGTLEIRSGQKSKQIAFHKGFPVQAESNLAGESLGQYLLDRGMISPDDHARLGEYVSSRRCSESAAVVGLSLLDARRLVGVLKDQTRRRVIETFGWPEGAYSIEPGEQAEAVQALRCDPLALVREGVAAHWPIERILGELAPQMETFPTPGKQVARLAERLATNDDQRACLARMDGTRTLGAALGAQASSPSVAAMAWMVSALGIVEFRTSAREDPSQSARAFDSEVEIHVEERGAAPAVADAAAPAAPTRAVAGGDADKAEALRQEIEKLRAGLAEMDHYQLLGLKSDAKAAQIKKAYFKAAKQFHPDTLARLGLEAMKEAAAEVFAHIAEAFEVLSDRQRRKDYDAVLRGELTEADALRLAQAETSYRKGEILLRMGDFAGAIDYLRPTVELWPDEGAYQAALGWALYKQVASEPEQARIHLEHAVALTPKDAQAHSRLATVLKALGKTELAAEHLALARSIDPSVG